MSFYTEGDEILSIPSWKPFTVGKEGGTLPFSHKETVFQPSNFGNRRVHYKSPQCYFSGKQHRICSFLTESQQLFVTLSFSAPAFACPPASASNEEHAHVQGRTAVQVPG